MLTSQMYEGIATPFTYNFKADLHKTDLIFGYDMTIEAVSTKLSWALSQTRDVQQIREIMYKDIAGEISEELQQVPVMKKY